MTFTSGWLLSHLRLLTTASWVLLHPGWIIQTLFCTPCIAFFTGPFEMTLFPSLCFSGSKSNKALSTSTDRGHRSAAITNLKPSREPNPNPKPNLWRNSSVGDPLLQSRLVKQRCKTVGRVNSCSSLLWGCVEGLADELLFLLTAIGMFLREKESEGWMNRQYIG